MHLIELNDTQALLQLLTTALLIYNSDHSILLFLALVRNREVIASTIKCILPAHLTIFLAFLSSGVLIIQTIRYRKTLSKDGPAPTNLIAKLMLFPSRTNHTRLFPKKHSFSYSYLLVGIPVGWQGSAGGMLSADVETVRRSLLSTLLSVRPGGAWYTVHADDYLARGHVAAGLRGKLEDYLSSQGIDPEKYPHAYLLTAGRFLGYAFNPLSIWYLYTSDKDLRAMILEVSNTFDERHIYFLKASTSASASSSDYFKTQNFSGQWSKEFYVSPLSDRSGEYHITATDPLKRPLNALVTLHSEGLPKLVARVFSEGPPLDPTTMTIWRKTRFLASWWWVGFATFFIRTIKEAFILKFLLGLRWYFRPEPREKTIARGATSTEVFMEGLFREHLRFLVSEAHIPLEVVYKPSGLSNNDPESIFSLLAADSPTTAKILEITVLTPSFYSSLLHHKSLFHAFHAAIHTFQTLKLSDWSLLPHLGYTRDQSPITHNYPKLTYYERIFFRLIQRLRFTWSSPASSLDQHPQQISPEEEIGKGWDQHWERYTTRRPSAFDKWVLSNGSEEESRRYKTILFRPILARYIALGSEELLYFELILTKSALCWWVLSNSQ